MKGKVQLVTNNITPSLNRIVSDLKDLPEEAYKVFVKNTPVDKGNARRRTKLRGKEIVADYAYAKKLDEGYSKQSPRGMTEPMIEFLDKKTKTILRK